ncbi:amino acid adenylation domain-containing protein [Streptomyces sp. NPDC005808]|uniref:amino acid adenylation domain-containing protein n=1 Tax=Streptomyces sp. NPDC005808 TaxID=3364734 RepID=UPI0036AE43B5
MTTPHRATAAALAAHRALNQGTTTPYPELSVKELFEAQAARRPTATALVHPEGRLSYRALDGLANDLAARMEDAGVRPGDTVAVLIARSAELIVTLLAAAKCGAAYLPADVSWPDGRLGTLLECTGSSHVLTRAADTGAVGIRLPGRTVVPVELGSLTERREPPSYQGSPDDIAYINFTSGSTGVPKGVPIRNRGIVRLVHNARYARLDGDTVLLQLAPASFDAATFEIWGALLNGGTCVLYPDSFVRLGRLRRVLTEHRVNVLFLTTALFNTVVDEAPETLDSVTTLLTGGEAHSLSHMATALRAYGADRIVSVYGPTECTTFATYHPVRTLHPDESSLPIGRPVQNTRAYVVHDGRLCEPGETGELLLAGPGLSPGYLGLPETNTRQFVEADIGGVRERLYCTGDRARLSEQGHLMFQGRLDDQVKVNGFRIELGEIAYHLDTHPAVRQSFVTTRPNTQGGQEIIAFAVPDTVDRDPEEIRAHLRGILPAYMVPPVIRFCAELPLTATGKVDRRTLLAAHQPLTIPAGASS